MGCVSENAAGIGVSIDCRGDGPVESAAVERDVAAVAGHSADNLDVVGIDGHRGGAIGHRDGGGCIHAAEDAVQ